MTEGLVYKLASGDLARAKMDYPGGDFDQVEMVLTAGVSVAVAWFNHSEITDFTAADDSIFLERHLFDGLNAGDTLDAGAFVLGTAAADADDRVIYDSATGNLYFDRDGAGTEIEIELFATLTPGTELSAADIMIYSMFG